MGKTSFIHSLTAAALLAVSLAGCQVQDDTAPQDTSLVVEGWIDSGGHPMVLLSETLPVRNGVIHTTDIISSIAKWAKVTVSDGDRSVILTGGPDTRYFPPYVFTSPEITGEPGKTYTLEVEYKDYKAFAETTIPQPVPIDTVYSRPLADSVYTLVCGFTDPPAKGNYYKVMTMTEGKDSRYMMSTIAMASDEVFDGYSEIVLWNTQRLDEPLYYPNMSPGEEVWVKLCTMDSRTFSFWSDYEVTVATNFNAMYYFDAAMEGGVKGALGYWAGYGVSEYKAVVEDIDTDED